MSNGPAPVAVTGGAGFIGSHVVAALAGAGHRVLAIDDLSTGSQANLDAIGGDIDLLEADAAGPRTRPALQAAGIKVVCHLAAAIDVRASVADPVNDAFRNVVGTVAVLQAAHEAGVRKVVFASSGGSIYGAATPPPVPETAAIAPESPYAASKAAAELWLHTFQRLYGLAWTSLALANVYGPRQDPRGEAGVISLFGANMLSGRPSTIYGDGTQTRDFVYVGDVAAAFLAACQQPVDAVRLNIGTGVETSVRQLHSDMARLCGVPDEPLAGPARPGEVHRSALDASLARDVLGWTPKTNLTAGLAETIAWLREDLRKA